jgi:hypothetical protein
MKKYKKIKVKKIQNLDTIHINLQSATKCIDLLNIKTANIYIKVKRGRLLGRGVN